jgi:predicted Rossmann fold nucleotide-binding protein DprA/Smf involved in DNA uptake
VKVAVIGSRTIHDYSLVKGVLDRLREQIGLFTVVTGGAPGVDSLAEIWALWNLPPAPLVFKADWSKGRGAGMARNRRVIEQADLVLAFWDGVSPGTKNALDQAREMEKTVVVYEVLDVDSSSSAGGAEYSSLGQP